MSINRLICNSLVGIVNKPNHTNHTETCIIVMCGKLD